MESTEIVSLVASICAAVSAIAAAVSCILMIRNSRPRIKIEIQKEGCGFWSNAKDHFAILPFRVSNKSQQMGEVVDITILFDKVEHHAELTSMNNDPFPAKIEIQSDGVAIDTEKFRLKCPFSVGGYASIFGNILFPSFPALADETVTVTVVFHFVRGKKRFRGVVFRSF